MKMTRDLLTNTKAIMTDAQNLKNIGAFADSMGQSESFDKYFKETYELEVEKVEFAGYEHEFLTEEQEAIYNEYTRAVAKELYKLNHH